MKTKTKPIAGLLLRAGPPSGETRGAKGRKHNKITYIEKNERIKAK